eukprot:6212360-Pleurochrysis_carterae.AAC.6
MLLNEAATETTTSHQSRSKRIVKSRCSVRDTLGRGLAELLHKGSYARYITKQTCKHHMKICKGSCFGEWMSEDFFET